MAKKPQFIIPKSKNILNTSREDIKKFYYSKNPLVRWVFWKRLKLIYSYMKNHKFKSILEVGSGSGIFIPTLTTMADKVVASDIHNHMDKIKKLIPKDSLSGEVVFEYGNITDIPHKNDSFNGVVSISTMEHIRDIDKAFSEVYRVMKKGGLFIIGIPADNWLTKLGFIILGEGEVIREHHCNSHQDIFKALKKQFKLVKVKRFWFPTIFPIYYVIIGRKEK